MDKVNILGAYIDKCNIEQASDKIIDMIENNEKCGCKRKLKEEHQIQSADTRVTRKGCQQQKKHAVGIIRALRGRGKTERAIP